MEDSQHYFSNWISLPYRKLVFHTFLSLNWCNAGN